MCVDWEEEKKDFCLSLSGVLGVIIKFEEKELPTLINLFLHYVLCAVKSQGSHHYWSFGHFLLFSQSFTSWNNSFFEIMTSAILPRRHCDAESRMTTTAVGQCRGCLPRQTKIDLIKIEVNQSFCQYTTVFTLCTCCQLTSTSIRRHSVAAAVSPMPLFWKIK